MNAKALRTEEGEDDKMLRALGSFCSFEFFYHASA
jgi:hypothetical protein